MSLSLCSKKQNGSNAVLTRTDAALARQRTAALDAIVLLPELGCFFTAAPTIMAVVHMPTAAQLAMLGLPEALAGNDFDDWERLHVTVLMGWAAPPDSCVFEVAVAEVSQAGQAETGPAVLSQLGCRVSPGGAEGV